MDECIGPDLVIWLTDLRHDVASIQRESPGVIDPVVLQRSVEESRILITSDKDYGSLVFERGLPHAGIILIRIPHARTRDKIAAMIELLELYPQDLAGNFVVTTGRKIRFAERETGSPTPRIDRPA